MSLVAAGEGVRSAVPRGRATRRACNEGVCPASSCMESRDDRLPSGGRILLAAAALVIVLAGMRVAAPVLILFAMAGFIVIVTRPIVVWLQARRVPTALAITAVITLTFAILALLVTVTTQSVNEIRLAFPRYMARYEQMQSEVLAWLADHDLQLPPTFRLDLVSAERALDFATGALRGLAGITSAIVLMLIVAIFGMIEANGLPAKVSAAFGDRFVPGRYGKIIAEVQHYLAIKTAVSLVTGLLIGLWVAAIGLDFAVLWGLMAFVLNFVPSIGSIVAAVPAVALALVQLGPNGAFMTLLAYIVVNTLLGNILEPTLLGRRLGLSPLVVILSVVFWGWLLGPIGFLLAVPLTMIGRIMFENTQDYRWIAVLMGPAPNPELAPRWRPDRWKRARPVSEADRD